MNVNDVLSRYDMKGISVGAHEKNPISQRAATMEALQKYSLGTDVVGKEQFLNEHQSSHVYNKMFNQDGTERKGFANSGKVGTATHMSGLHQDLRMMRADVEKTHGKAITSPGASTGLGMGWQGNRVASRGALLANGVVDGARLVGEGGLNALGIMTKQQKTQFKTGGALQKAMAVAPAAFSLYNNVSTLLDGGDIGDALAMNLTAVGTSVGFHAGKSVSGAFFKGGSVKAGVAGASKITGGKMRIASQLVGGVMGGVVGTAVAAAVTYGAKDLTSSESSIAKAATGYSKLNELANITQTRDTLTMRQRALQQLSQSAMNDRGSLLGNEAAILKNLM